MSTYAPCESQAKPLPPPASYGLVLIGNIQQQHQRCDDNNNKTMSCFSQGTGASDGHSGGSSRVRRSSFEPPLFSSVETLYHITSSVVLPPGRISPDIYSLFILCVSPDIQVSVDQVRFCGEQFFFSLFFWGGGGVQSPNNISFQVVTHHWQKGTIRSGGNQFKSGTTDIVILFSRFGLENWKCSENGKNDVKS